MGLGIELTFVPTLEPDLPFGIPTDLYGLPPVRFGRARRPRHDLHDEPPAGDADDRPGASSHLPWPVAGSPVSGKATTSPTRIRVRSIFSELNALGLIAPISTNAAVLSLVGGDGAHARRRCQRVGRRASLSGRRSAIPAPAWRHGSEHRPIRRRGQLPLLTIDLVPRACRPDLQVGRSDLAPVQRREGSCRDRARFLERHARLGHETDEQQAVVQPIGCAARARSAEVPRADRRLARNRRPLRSKARCRSSRRPRPPRPVQRSAPAGRSR